MLRDATQFLVKAGELWRSLVPSQAGDFAVAARKFDVSDVGRSRQHGQHESVE